MSVEVTYSSELRNYMDKRGMHNILIEMYQPQC
jgi:hypothetical protein